MKSRGETSISGSDRRRDHFRQDPLKSASMLSERGVDQHHCEHLKKITKWFLTLGAKRKRRRWMEINEAAPLKVGELAAAADRKGICCKRA